MCRSYTYQNSRGEIDTTEGAETRRVDDYARRVQMYVHVCRAGSIRERDGDEDVLSLRDVFYRDGRTTKFTNLRSASTKRKMCK